MSDSKSTEIETNTTFYQKAKTEIISLWQLDRELSGLLTLDLMIIASALGFGLGVMV